MAIGIARLFGIRLPVNFNSPYKAVSITEFWHRWHMTLSRFLRDYLYIPLGGNRRGKVQRYRNLLLTMLLGGLWHGAGWTFVFWGGLHGVYLCAHHAWTYFRRRMGWHDPARDSRLWTLSAGLLTFLAVVVGWVFFRATTFSGAGTMLLAMVGMTSSSSVESTMSPASVLPVLLGLQSLVWLAPNTQQFMRRFRPALYVRPIRESMGELIESARRLAWKPNWQWATVMAVLSTVSLLLMSRTSEFIYYQF